MNIDYIAIMPSVAEELWGPATQKDEKKWTWGNKGARSIVLEKGIYYDFEKNKGGGVLDLLKQEGHGPEWLTQHGYISGKEQDQSKDRIVAIYDYTDEARRLLFQVVRKNPRAFVQRRPNCNGGWIWNKENVRSVPYRLPELLEAVSLDRTVYIVEGEKDVETLVEKGLDATCNAGGAGKWSMEFGEFLKGADVVVIPDNDEVGRKHADAVLKSLTGKAKRIRRLELPGLSAKGDVSDWFGAGGTIELFHELAATALLAKFDESSEEEPPDQQKYSNGKDFEWLTAENVNGPILNGNWLVKGMIPRQGLGVFYGRPGCGKSIIAADISLHIAEGLPWRGIKTIKGGATYIASEAGRMGINRIFAWYRYHGRKWSSSFRMSPIALDLRSTDEDVHAMASDIAVNQPNCVFIVIDTLARNIAGGNENSSEDMGAFVANIALLSELTGAFVLIIHHGGKDESKGARGHSSLTGAVDFSCEIKRDPDKPGRLHVTKLRDGQDGAKYDFNIHAVDLGADEDGDRVTAPVAIDFATADAKATRARKPQGINQERVFKDFDIFVRDHGVATPIGAGFPGPGQVKAVDEAAFRHFAAQNIGGEVKYQARNVSRALDPLIDRKLLKSNGGLLWKM